MIEKFFYFSDMNRDSNQYSLEDAFTQWPTRSTKFISMGDDEDAYLFSMQLMLGKANVIPFQRFHDEYWMNDERKKTGYRYVALRDYLDGSIFCTDPYLLGYMSNYQGDLKWAKAQKEKAHWSEPKAQLRILDGFY